MECGILPRDNSFTNHPIDQLLQELAMLNESSGENNTQWLSAQDKIVESSFSWSSFERKPIVCKTTNIFKLNDNTSQKFDINIGFHFTDCKGTFHSKFQYIV